MTSGNRKITAFRIATMMMALAIIPAVAWAAGQQDSVTWRVSTGGMDWSILVPENGSVLKIGGNGLNYQKVFKAGERPRFSPNDIGGELLDGTYKWELRITPRGVEPIDETGLDNGRDSGPSLNRQLPARARIERKALEDSLVRSGGFSVLNGGIIDPNQVEPGAASSNGLEGQGASQ